MKIAAITQDQVIVIDGNAAFMRELDGFLMERGEWAVRFDTDLGIGTIEYTDSRNNRSIDAAEFNAHYSWLEVEHQRYVDHKAAEAAAEAAANEPDPISEPGGDSGSV